MLLAQSAAKESAVQADVIIDNVLFFSDDRQSLAIVCNNFVHLCECVTVTIGDYQQPSQRQVHRGIEFNLCEKTLRLKEKWCDKILKRLEIAQTIEQWRSIGGSLAWVLAAVAPQLSLFYFWKWLARQSRENDRKKVEPWPSVQKELALFQEFVKENTPQAICYSTAPHLLITDASGFPGAGWGAILVNLLSGTIQCDAGLFEGTEARYHINELEVMAIEKAIHSFHRDLPPGKCVNVLCDNEVAVACVNKGSSKAFFLNQKVTQLKKLTQQLGIDLLLQWLPSKENPADPLSRGKDLSQVQIEQIEVWRWEVHARTCASIWVVRSGDDVGPSFHTQKQQESVAMSMFTCGLQVPLCDFAERNEG